MLWPQISWCWPFYYLYYFYYFVLSPCGSTSANAKEKINSANSISI
uniref:Macaca fascicularis brain cDNA clone: QflA-23028, similar to human O-acyltransferase (membrane bound) domain containing 1(OACT1), mRNA, RefSeq: XM_371801.2 n=1 Tax=Macaca fascicularis TaxID=9541 RepID=I7G7K6_MACFA|nr:unnamed protein product [Macaca fascicularis]